MSTLFSLLLGLPGAFILSHYRFPGRKLLRALSGVPFVLPPILLVLGFVIFFGNSGIINSILMAVFDLDRAPLRILYSLKAIILAHGFYNFPIALRLVSSLWEQLPKSQEWAAQTLGARRWRLFLTIVLPQLMPAIIAAASLIFMFCFTSFAIILVLGGGPRFSTIEVEIYRLAKTSLDIPSAGALSLVAIVLTLGIMFVYVKLQNRLSFQQQLDTRHEAPLASVSTGKKNGILILLYGTLMIFLILGPLLSVLLRSLQRPLSRGGQNVFSLKWYRDLFAGTGSGQFSSIALPAIGNSLFIGIFAALLAVILGTSLSYFLHRYRLRNRNLIDTLSMAPMSVSSVILGLGYFILLRHLPDIGDRPLLVIIAAHSVIAYPFVVRTVGSVIKKISPNQRYAAMLLGAKPGEVFRTVELPLLLPSMGAAGIFAFAISLGEINATLLFSSSTTTIPLAIYRLIGAYNFFGACALGSILILVSTLVFAVFDFSGEAEL